MIAALTLLLAQAVTATPSAAPSPVPAVAISPEFMLYDLRTAGVASPFAEISNALLNVTVNAGDLHANATAGDYAFPTVGFTLANDNASGANADLYGSLPVASLSYTFDSHLSVAAGKFAALLGQESPFTYENLNIQRGIGWAMEPTISRGVQITYTNGPWTARVQENDAYYSGGNRAFEWLVGWSPSSATSVQFAAIVPGANVPGNRTSTIGNKAEYDLMYARAIGKAELLPYVLWVHSPASPVLGYTTCEHAYAAVLLGAWNFSPQTSLAFRYEHAKNGSSANDANPNADLVGFGPGSLANSQTLTPAFRFGNGGMMRFEYSHVSAAGLNQNRYGFEFGVMH